MSSFSIPDVPPKIELNKGSVDEVSGAALSPHTGVVQFAVNNGAGEIIDGKLSVLPDGQAKPEWFAIDGTMQRDFGTTGSETVKVNVSVPADVAQGDYSFRLQVAAVTDPDNEFAISPSTAFTVPAAEKKGGKKKSKWWLWLLLALLALAIIGGVVFALTRKKDPPVDPATPTPTAEPTTAVVPDLIGRTVAEAKNLSTEFDFKANPGEVTGAQPNTVLTQNPAKDLTRSKGDPLVVTFDPGVQVPPLVNSQLAAATNAILAAKLVQGKVETRCVNSGAANRVLDQNPDPGGPVASGTTVTLTISSLPPSPLLPCRNKILTPLEVQRATAVSKAVSSTTVTKSVSGIQPR